jgi:hypothetical protein
VYMFVYAHIWFDDSEVGWWLRLWGRKSGGWAALMDSLWRGDGL